MSIKVTLIEKLFEEFGKPNRMTKKVHAWNITSRFGFVVEVDVPVDDSYANVWLPMPPESIEAPDIETKIYPAGKGRHSNTYTSPGLEKGLVICA